MNIHLPLDSTWREHQPVMAQLKQKAQMWLSQSKTSSKAPAASKKRRMNEDGLNELLSGSYSCETLHAPHNAQLK